MTLPYSFLVLSRKDSRTPNLSGSARIIGRPRDEKGHLDVLSCSADGVEELVAQKRDVPAFVKEVRKGRADSVQRWTREGKRITAVTRAEECS